MVPDIAVKGHSFKGALAYYLHDKRQGDGPQPETAERVAWSETRNLATDDPHIAERIMIATARHADALKAAAGVKNTGRKSTAHVYAYSLAWHPDESDQLDRAEMIRAADLSLKALAADHLQAIIVCHRDQKHPHVHIVLNRVDPDTGKMHGFSKDREILSAWANQYERERGQILTPRREEKRLLQEAFAKEAAPRPSAAQERPKAPRTDKSPAAMLKELGDAQKARHGDEWRALAATNKAAREQVYAAYGERIKTAADRHKAETKPAWAQYFKEARTAERSFAMRETSIGGVIRNALDATTHQRITGAAGDRGRLALTFRNVLSSQARAAAFAERQNLNRQEFAAGLKSALDSDVAGLKEQRARALARQRATFDKTRLELIARQDLERGKVREAWRQIYADRGKDPRRSTPPRPRELSSAVSPLPPEKPIVKDDFDKAREIDAKRSTPAPQKRVQLATPVPSPSPSGSVPVPAMAARSVPKVDKVKEWAKTPGGKRTIAAQGIKGPAPIRKDWGKTATPVASPAQPAPAMRKDWNAKAPETSRPIKPLPPGGPTKDRERD